MSSCVWLPCCARESNSTHTPKLTMTYHSGNSRFQRGDCLLSLSKKEEIGLQNGKFAKKGEFCQK